jgi:hypothetical protein
MSDRESTAPRGLGPAVTVLPRGSGMEDYRVAVVHFRVRRAFGRRADDFRLRRRSGSLRGRRRQRSLAKSSRAA